MTESELQAALAGMNLDLGYMAALHVLGWFLPDENVAQCISVSRRGRGQGDVLIDWPALHACPTFSTGEQLLIGAAYSLFSATDTGPGLGAVCAGVDQDCARRVIDAMTIRAGLQIALHV